MTGIDWTGWGTLSAGLALPLVALVFGGYLHRALWPRLRRLEEALRVYNQAIAAMGRQLTAVETELARERAARKAAQAPQTASATVAAESREEEEFSEAELRLAQLIKSRLATLRVN